MVQHGDANDHNLHNLKIQQFLAYKIRYVPPAFADYPLIVFSRPLDLFYLIKTSFKEEKLILKEV